MSRGWFAGEARHALGGVAKYPEFYMGLRTS